MATRTWLLQLALAMATIVSASPAWAQNVRVTPLGSHTGEFCRNDRALLFEDPTGLRILYDAGRTVAGADDSRLGNVHVIILTSVHSDHIGDVKATAVNAGSCANPTTASAAPNSNVAEIAAAKRSTIVVGGEMHTYLSAKITAAGAKVAACPGVENLTVSDPPVAPDLRTCISRHGAKRIIRLGTAAQGVQIATVRADHSNGVPIEVLDPASSTNLKPDNLTAYVGPESGYVLKFTNGLTVYLSGDTGHTGDMATIVNGYYGANLAVVHMGDIFTMGPEEAAFAVRELIKPKAVIPEHANEAATSGGKVLPKTRTARFIELVKGIPVHLPLSDKTMQFDKNGTCVAGC
jgi:L-ascorbate metabolism protein UlaG (beta-lactamase superfamily)